MTSTFRRRWFQFSLASLFLLVVIVAVPCGWLKAKMDRKAKERTAVAEIRKVGGGVLYDWQFPEQKEPPGATWIRKLFGDEFLAKVALVSYVGPEVTDDSLANLEVLADLEILSLADTKITNASLVHLKTLTKLRVLVLYGTGVNGTGLVHLNKLTRLEELDLEKSKVTNDGLSNLTGLAGLKLLNLHNTDVTDAGVAELQKALPNCEIIR